MVEKYVKQAHEAGIPCVSGSAYDDLGVKREGDPWHLLNCEASVGRLSTMLNDAVRCALEIWPWGSSKELWDEWLSGEDQNVWKALLSSPPRDAPGDRGDVTPTRKGEDSDVLEVKHEEVAVSTEQTVGTAGAGAVVDAEERIGAEKDLATAVKTEMPDTPGTVTSDLQEPREKAPTQSGSAPAATAAPAMAPKVELIQRERESLLL